MLSKPKLRSKHQQHDFRDLAMHFWHTVAISDLESRSECAHRAYLNPEETWNGWTCALLREARSRAHVGMADRAR